MAKHEFGIMQKEPLVNERYDTYEPQEYNCIAVDDDFIEPIIIDLQGVDCYWHSLKTAEKGLAYCGITLIPPRSMEEFTSILLYQNKRELSSLIELANQAKDKGKYVIHYGM
ncbi:hypothetical protein [Proteiniclasticum ruminis]|uniref:Uncharacterized protein n=1 Tax=Proteiniclasticum ruminis TaxID=398199 RepID=A0A1I5ECB0_9CLOT|nr:hypothetical protein [Proteiniclasticum ruminis]SFO08711.1 hypothetical protein SAMN04488695_11512 [Proteiniclasticum ruminis]